jgi:hypothetical protein
MVEARRRAVDRGAWLVFAVAAALIAWACINLMNAVVTAPQPY